MDAFIKKGFYTIGALKTNRIVYPCGIKQKISELALHLRKTDSDVSLVTVGSRSYYVYRYEGTINRLMRSLKNLHRGRTKFRKYAGSNYSNINVRNTPGLATPDFCIYTLKLSAYEISTFVE